MFGYSAGVFSLQTTRRSAFFLAFIEKQVFLPLPLTFLTLSFCLISISIGRFSNNISHALLYCFFLKDATTWCVFVSRLAAAQSKYVSALFPVLSGSVSTTSSDIRYMVYSLLSLRTSLVKRIWRTGSLSFHNRGFYFIVIRFSNNIC